MPEPTLYDDLPEIDFDDMGSGESKVFIPSVKEKQSLKATENSSTKKCKLNSKKIYKVFEDEQQLKAQVDVIKAALKEIKKKTSPEFNKNAGVMRIEKAAGVLKLSEDVIIQLKKDWTWLYDNVSDKDYDGYKCYETLFFEKLRSKRLKLKLSKYPQAQVLDWIKFSASPILDIICEVADSEVSVLELWVSAYKEGLIYYVQDYLHLDEKEIPTKVDLNTTSIDEPVDGFQYLGLDDFYIDYHSKKYPLKQFLPKLFNLSELMPAEAYNEQTPPRLVKYAIFPNMKMAIQALKANYKRRKKIFINDAKRYGYATPTKDEIVYWLYVYSNVGIYGGKKSLKEYKDERVLSDWIKKGKYKNSIKVYESYKLAEELGLFQ